MLGLKQHCQRLLPIRRKRVIMADWFLPSIVAIALFISLCVVIFSMLRMEEFAPVKLVSPSYRDIPHDGHQPTFSANRRSSKTSKEYRHEKRDVFKASKQILFWNKYFSTDDYELNLGHNSFLESGCPVSNCFLTADRTLLNSSDAVIFHANDFNERDMPDPRHRRPSQRFIFYNYETVLTASDMPMFTQTKNFFNWTMTYRRDSDIYDVRPYGSLRRRADARPPPSSMPIRLNPGTLPPDPASLMMSSFNRSRSRPMLAKKKKMVAWFVSRCHSDGLREEYFNLLAQHVDVDMYGGCGPLKCMPSRSEKCDKLLDGYKFYVAAENAICADYVTEKFYRALASDIVPIVYGGADYSAYAPPLSYIDAADFVSPKALADYLKLLHENDGLYLKYFDWKKDYEVVSRPTDGWCELCEKLNDANQPTKFYNDLTDWWFHKDIPCLPGYNFLETLLPHSSQ